MGDHNEFYEHHQIHKFQIRPGLSLDLKTINPATGKPYNTCCGDEFTSPSHMNPPGNWGRPFDLAYSNIPSLQMEVETTILPKFKKVAKPFVNSTHSDHYPIKGTFTI